jgi:hypothetical protein
MTVTTGARGTRSSGASSASCEMTSSSRKAVDSIWKPKSLAMRLAVSRSMFWLMVTPIIPRPHSFLMISLPLTLMR